MRIITIKLMHPKLGLCAQEVIMKNVESVKKKWKLRYGKKYDECTVIVERKLSYNHGKKIINIRTGDVYDNTKEAADDIGVSEETINKHLNRRLAEKNAHLYLVKWAKT